MQKNLYSFYGVLIWIMALFLFISDYKTLKKVQGLKKENDLSLYTKVDYSKKSKIMFGVLFFLTIAIMFTTPTTELHFILINSAIMFICVVEFICSFFTMQLYLGEKTFAYEGELYRYKSIKSIKKVKRFGRNTEVAFFDGNCIMVTEMIGTSIKERAEKQKEEKESRKRK